MTIALVDELVRLHSLAIALFAEHPDWSYEEFVANADPDLVELTKDWESYRSSGEPGDSLLAVLIARYNTSCHALAWDERFPTVQLTVESTLSPVEAEWPLTGSVGEQTSNNGVICLEDEDRRALQQAFDASQMMVFGDGDGTWELTIRLPKPGAFFQIACGINLD